MRKCIDRIWDASGIAVAASLLAAGPVAASQDCLICDRQVVLNSWLAACFLERYSVLANRDRPVIVVDLSDCPKHEEKDRGVVEALSMPERAPLKPSTKFMLSRNQLVCLKRKLENEEIGLDPAARIGLDECE